MRDKNKLIVDTYNHNKNQEEQLEFRGDTMPDAERRFDEWRDRQGRHHTVLNIRYLYPQG